MKAKNLKLSTKFSLAIGLILLTFCVIFSVLLYHHLKDRVIEDAHEKADIILTQIEAVGGYVKGTLRPRMFNILPRIDTNDEFIVEAMSTTHVSLEVMRRFNQNLKEYVYKRVSDNPLNPKNKTDSFHSRMIAYFEQDRTKTTWRGIIDLENQKYLVQVRPIITEHGCLRCHGDPSQAPKGLRKKYGEKSGFRWAVGKVVGVESVAIPVDVTLQQVKSVAISTFIFGFATLLFLFIALQGAFWQLVSKPLNRLAEVFTGIAKGTEPLGQELPVTTSDEIGELTASFNLMARHLFNAQESLKENVETLQSIFDGISDPLALVNPDCSLAMTNSAYREWMSQGSPAVFGKESHELAHHAGILCPVCFLEQAQREKRAISGYWKAPDGQHYSTYLYPILDNHRNVARAVHYVKNITDRKQIEEQMMEAEKLAALGQLSAGVAHEINNPLGVILTYTKLLLRESAEGSQQQQDIKVIEKHAKNSKTIVENLLSFSRHNTTNKKAANLNDCINEVLLMIAKQFEKDKIILEKNMDPSIPPMVIDQEKMKQVYLNLFMNAKQAIVSGGKLTVTTRFIPEKKQVEARVQDTGEGIPPNIIGKIFEPFFTTKKTGEGTGLGLSISYGIIKEHGGQIRVESEPGKGSIFIISLPVEEINVQET